MQLKNAYIKGNDAADKSYLEIFDRAEEILDRINISPCSDRDVQLSANLDIDFIKTERRANAEMLHKVFEEWLIFPKLSGSDTPLFVPILVPDGKRDELRNFLIKNEIYCPVHWPVSEYHNLNEQEKFIYDNELSLVCDQRYTEKDMQRMVNTINRFWKEA